MFHQVILSRREEVLRLEQEGEEGMIHSLLTSLPDLYEESEAEVAEEIAESADVGKEPAVQESGPPEQLLLEKSVAAEESASDSRTEGTPAFEVITTSAGSVAPQECAEKAGESLPDVPTSKSDEDQTAISATTAEELSISLSKGEQYQSSEKQHASVPPSPTLSAHLSSRPRISLSTLLRQADDLYARFPPSHPDVAVSSIMGPQSVMLTWSEDPSELPDDDEAELMVLKPELVVLPHIDQDEEVASDEEYEKSPRHKRRARKEQEREERRRRKLRKPRRMGDVVLQRKTMVAGAVLVLGVAMAVYGMQSGAAANIFNAGEGHRRHHLEREWKRLSGFIGGAVLGVGERMFGGFVHG